MHACDSSLPVNQEDRNLRLHKKKMLTKKTSMFYWCGVAFRGLSFYTARFNPKYFKVKVSNTG